MMGGELYLHSWKILTFEVVIQWDCEKLKVYNLIPRENTKVNAKRYN